MRRLARVLAGTLAGLALLTAAAPARAGVTLTSLGSFEQPMFVAAAPQDPDRLYVAQRQGVVRVVRGGSSSAFVDLSGRVLTDGERGLLSVAFAPDFASSGTFYAFLTARADAARSIDAGDLVVARLHATSPDAADAASFEPVLVVPHDRQSNHNGGTIAFGPDGSLFVGTGDGGAGGDPSQNAQLLDPAVTDQVAAGVNHDFRLGKLLRLDVSRPGPAVAAAGNPFGSVVWASGLRNPFRFAFDRLTGDLSIGDVGQEGYEEIDALPAPAFGRGANLGWSRFEGVHDYATGHGLLGSPVTAPVIEKSHAGDGWNSITGGVVVRDPRLPELAGRYVYGDYTVRGLWSANLCAGQPLTDARLPGLDVAGLVHVGQDAVGRVYVVSLDQGTVQRLDPAPGPPVAPAASCPRAGADSTAPVAAPPADRRAPRLTFVRALRQRPLRTGRLRLTVRCDEDCRAIVRGSVRIGRTRIVLGSGRASLAAGARVAVDLRLSRAAKRALVRRLRPGARARAAVVLTLVDAAGNTTRRTVRLTVTR